MKNRTQSVVKADETGFYYNSGIDYPKEVYKHDLETSENEICISEEEAKAAFGKEYLQLIIWDVREDGILFHLVDEKQIKYKSKSVGVEMNTDTYEFIDTKITD